MPWVLTARKRIVASVRLSSWCAPSAPTGKAIDLALGQLAPAVRRAQVRRALQDDQHLLLAEVEVVGVGGLAGRQLPQAQPEARGGELVAEPRAPAREAGMAARLVEVRRAKVGHACVSNKRGTLARSAAPRRARPQSQRAYGSVAPARAS